MPRDAPHWHRKRELVSRYADSVAVYDARYWPEQSPKYDVVFRHASPAGPLVLDVGCGTALLARYWRERLGRGQRWTGQAPSPSGPSGESSARKLPEPATSGPPRGASPLAVRETPGDIAPGNIPPGGIPRGGFEYVGVDFSRPMLRRGRARERAAEAKGDPRLRVHLVEADVAFLPVRDRVGSCVASFSVLQNLPDPASMLAEVRRVAGEAKIVPVSGGASEGTGTAELTLLEEAPVRVVVTGLGKKVAFPAFEALVKGTFGPGQFLPRGATEDHFYVRVGPASRP